jgi:hypothetical protein
LKTAAGIASALLILLVLLDVFESMILPRRVGRRLRIGRAFYRASWAPWKVLAQRMQSPKLRNNWLAWYGPLSLLTLFVVWALGLIAGFAGLHWALQTPLQDTHGPMDFRANLYFSGVTFFTLGYGDIIPVDGVGRLLAVIESGLGFGFLAVVIGYLPTLYQTFSKREVMISLLDARAGSPPTGSQILIRMSRAGNLQGLDGFFLEWEKWCAELLESTMSYPAIAWYRSQHDNQSWLSALAAILDATSLAIANTAHGTNTYQAQVSFAMARHAVVDIALLFFISPDRENRRGGECGEIRRQMELAGLDATSAKKLDELRGMYEPYLMALSRMFLLPLPPVAGNMNVADNWQSSAGMRRVTGLDHLGDPIEQNEHFD